MNNVNIENLKEQKQHGESMLPVALYRVDHHVAGSILPYHWHNELEFIYLSTGQAVFTIDDTAIPVQAGECIFVNGGQIHSGFSDTDDTTYFSVVFSVELLTNSFDACRKYFDGIITNKYQLVTHFRPGLYAHGEVISGLAEIIKELTDKKAVYELALKGRLFSIFTTIFRENLYALVPVTSKKSMHMKKYDLLKNILGYISQNHNKKITLTDVGQSVNLTPQYICRFFKEMTGVNVVDYINNHRIETAGTLLKVSNLSITDIALECGFDNISYFNRLFKKQTGCTPTEYKILARQ